MNRIIRFVGRWILLPSILVLGIVFFPRWWPYFDRWVTEVLVLFRPAITAPEASAEESQDENLVILSPQALKNLGIDKEHLVPVEKTRYTRTINIPGVVVEPTGTGRLHVSALMTGIVTHVHVTPGEAVLPGSLICRIQLTHEDLVQAQIDFLETLGELDVEESEHERLKKHDPKLVAKALLEHEYSHAKLTSHVAALRESLMLHGLSQTQIEEIASRRKLLREIEIHAPFPDDHSGDQKVSRFFEESAISLLSSETETVPEVDQNSKQENPPSHSPVGAQNPESIPLLVQKLNIAKGKSVLPGENLCELVYHETLHIQGLAFDRDLSLITRAADQGWAIEAVVEGAPLNMQVDRSSSAQEVIHDLKIMMIESNIDPESRSLKFNVLLKNELHREIRDKSGKRYLSWKYRPGQRMQLRVPLEVREEAIVVPSEALARDGAESYVFLQDGKNFRSIPVHVIQSDPRQHVLAEDGSIFVGEILAIRGARELLIALKNKGSGESHDHHQHDH